MAPSRGRAFRGACVALTVLCHPMLALAAPGFVADSHVERGAVYAELVVEFRCNVQYLGHDPYGASDVVRVQLETTSVCTGAAPTIADSREQFRPVGADDAHVVSIEYDGESAGDRQLRVNFSDTVRFDVRPGPGGNSILVRVFGLPAAEEAGPVEPREATRLVERPAAASPLYVINLESWQRPPTSADLPAISLEKGKKLFVSEAAVGGLTWYRIRVGYFETAEAAARDLRRYRERYPGAWIDRADAAAGDDLFDEPAQASEPAPPLAAAGPGPGMRELPEAEIAELMTEGRRAMTAGELPRAVQVYTKVLQLPPNAHQAEAQEYLALARERNGQIAHARAEYQRYLDVYPEGAGAERVRQRLSALLAGAAAASPDAVPGTTAARRAASQSPWRLRTFLTQYYRRDVNQLNDQDEIVSQSSIYSDASIDARRRGERFDFSARVTAGYRNDLMKEERLSTMAGNDLRISYAYADLADSRTGLRGRIGRQTRNTGGVLGRFDGLNLTYAVSERLRFEAVGGVPVYSTTRDDANSRSFYGLSSAFSPFSENLELGVFLLNQEIEGLTDRQATGAEVRYSGEKSSLWGIADYDAEFGALGSAFLQGSWRLPGKLTLTGLVDRRRSPFLSLGNALVGQSDQEFENLAVLLTEDEIRSIALDRSALSTTYTFGLSRPMSPRLQLNLNASHSAIEATPESAGVAAAPGTEYSYYSADFVASSLIRQGDVGILGLRYAVSDTTTVYTVNLDTRFPLGQSWRFSPRLRVDYREIQADQSTQWIYTPELRLQYRWGRRLRLELEAGRQYSMRDMAETDMDRESYFINVGYQYFY